MTRIVKNIRLAIIRLLARRGAGRSAALAMRAIAAAAFLGVSVIACGIACGIVLLADVRPAMGFG